MDTPVPANRPQTAAAGVAPNFIPDKDAAPATAAPATAAPATAAPATAAAGPASAPITQLSLQEALTRLKREADALLTRAKEQEIIVGDIVAPRVRQCLESYNRLHVVSKKVIASDNGALYYINDRGNKVYLKRYQILQCYGKCRNSTDPNKVCLKGFQDAAAGGGAAVCKPPSRREHDKIQKMVTMYRF